MPRDALPAFVLVGLVLAAGCQAAPGIGPTAEPTTSDDRGTDCPTAEDYERRPLPDRPDAFTNESVAEFAAAYEEARIWNENVGAHHKLGVSGDAELLNRTDDGWRVRVSGGVSYHTCTAGHAIADGFFATIYFVNESVLYRADVNPDERVRPRTEGDLVERLTNASNKTTE